MADRIFIDEAQLQTTAQQYLRSPYAQKVYEEFDVSFGMCLFMNCLVGCFGLLMLPTIRWTLDGAKCLWSAATFESFGAMKKNARHNPGKLRALILHLIIIGPDRKHALAVGTFRPAGSYSADWLAQAAAKLANIYTQGPSSPSEQPLYELLRDDTFHPNRRRLIPPPIDYGLELMLFDVEIENLAEGRETPYESVMFTFLAEPEEKGGIIQVPWAVAAEAVQVR
jgi:hypothetical protein